MRLDLIIPTFNRQALLSRTLDSVLAAHVPAGLDVRVTVVDNRSTDGTRETVQSYEPAFGGRLSYLYEARTGKSFALNHAIAVTGGELVGMIDDDEEVDTEWFREVHSAFEADDLDFIGGPYIPRWSSNPPEWLPTDYRAVVGWVDGGDEVRVFGSDYPGMLMGGNAVIRRSLLLRAGPYSTQLGRFGTGLMAAEDEDMYKRLIALGARGLYLPRLRIYHYVPPERLTKRYHRLWCFWRGASCGVLERRHPAPVAHLLGVPRWMYGRALRAVLRQVKMLGRRQDPGRRFCDELAVWDLVGFFYGIHFRKGEH